MQLQRRILFPNAFAIDNSREIKHKSILAILPIDLTTKNHKKGKKICFSNILSWNSEIIFDKTKVLREGNHLQQIWESFEKWDPIIWIPFNSNFLNSAN